MEKRFLILPVRDIDCKIKSVPWDFVASYEENAINLHGQNLARLNERKGLSPKELYCVVYNIKFFKCKLSEKDCALWLESLF